MRRSVPTVLLIPALLGLAFLVLPLAALLIRAPWAALPAVADSRDALTSVIPSERTTS